MVAVKNFALEAAAMDFAPFLGQVGEDVIMVLADDVGVLDAVDVEIFLLT